MLKMKNRIAALLGATVVTVGASLSVGAGSAGAAVDDIDISLSRSDGGKSLAIYIYADGKYAGYAKWNADPDSSGNPGDALMAYDGAADGYGVRASTAFDNYVTERSVSTYGHDSPYTTPWNTGNLTEGTHLWLGVCVGTSSNEVCATPQEVWA